MNPSFNTIGILGSGTMGAGIAQISAQNGASVVLYDIEQRFLDTATARIRESLQKAVEKGKLPAEDLEPTCARISYSTRLEDLQDCDLIIEAVPEDMALKKRIFGELDGICKPETILASNTSSLSITALGGATQRPQQVAGLHFFNPVPLMRLVEVIRGQRTSEETVQALQQFAKALGKTPVIAQDTPGFIVNRVARPFYGEALKILGENAGSPEVIRTIDTVMREAGGFRMGPFELMDLIGIDVNYAVTQSVWNAYFQCSRYRPHPIQRKMVEAGLLGKKSQEGFYKYE
ncbi:MAG TPA: 3-hydroxyacyl-CoA dehydrogenase NAD-binding domain-containing protein [Coleofasciculaceae cyanobacterium]|jgi:3-hydroxybutyryl-CoA dehydrogenase